MVFAARNRGVSYGAVFSEGMLREMSRKKPTTLDSLRSFQIVQVTAAKLNNYQEEFEKLLDICRHYDVLSCGKIRNFMCTYIAAVYRVVLLYSVGI